MDRSQPAGARAWRRPLAAFLTAVSVISLVLAVSGTWVRSTLFDTDDWVAAVAPLPQDEELQNLVSAAVAVEVLQVVDVEDVLGDTLGPAARFLAGPLEGATEGFVEDATRKVIASPRFEVLWADANRVAHEAAVRLLRGESDASVVDGKVSFDLVPLINNTIAAASEATPQLFGGAVSIPEITADQVGEAGARLSELLGIEIPPDFGQVTVFDEDQLEALQGVVRLIDDGVVALWVIFVLSFVGALAASPNRRRSVAVMGTGVALAAVALWLLRAPVESSIIDQIGSSEGKQAAQIVIEAALWNNLGVLIWSLVVAALAGAAVAFLAGPSRAAVGVRRTVAGLFGGDRRPQTAASRFMRSHTAGFRVAGAAGAVVAAASLPQLTWGWALTIAIVLAAYEASWAFVPPDVPAAA